MGNWNISISGVGMHHNNSENDADQIAAKAVAQLLAVGHTVSVADFTSGSHKTLLPEPFSPPVSGEPVPMIDKAVP